MICLMRCVVGVALLVLGGSPALGTDPAHFDLLCDGTLRESIMQQSQTPARRFLRLSIDLQTKRFCLDRLCGSLSMVSQDRLAYHCDIDNNGDRPPEAVRLCPTSRLQSSGGPFLSQDDFVFYFETGVFKRSARGRVGDIVSGPYWLAFDGKCQRTSYTGVPADGQ